MHVESFASTMLMEATEKVNMFPNQHDITGKQTKLYVNGIQVWLSLLKQLATGLPVTLVFRFGMRPLKQQSR
jgi:hypothetical protein